MPGHVKKSTGPDPDPSPWLLVSDELKVKLKSKPYDPKKSCWVPDKATHGYWEGVIESTDGDKVSVKILETKDVILFILKNVIICEIMTKSGFFRSRFSRRTKLTKSTHPSLIAVMTWLA